MTESAARSATTSVHRRDSDAIAVWIDGVRKPSDAAHLSARDRGFTLADGLFETMRVRYGRVFRREHHLARLRRSLATLQIAVPEGLGEWVLRAAAEAGPGECSLRLTVTRGVGPGGLAPIHDAPPTTVAVLAPMPRFATAIYEGGLSAHLASGRRNERAMTAGLKTLSYTDAVAGLLEAQRAGADEALFLDGEDHLSEATASNLFAWTGTELLTPPVSCAALPGITRAAILEMAYGLGMAVVDRPFGLDELTTAREAFLTSSLRGVVPLVRVDGRPLGDGVPGEITRRLMSAYAALVERDCGAG